MHYGFYYGIPNGFFVVLATILLIAVVLAVFITYLALAAIVSPGALLLILSVFMSGSILSSNELWVGSVLISFIFAFGLWRYYQSKHKVLKIYASTAVTICLLVWLVNAYNPNTFITKQVDIMLFGAINQAMTSTPPPPAPVQPQPQAQPPASIFNTIEKTLPIIGNGRINGNDVNLRMNASIKAPIIGKLREGENVTIRMEMNEWYMVTLENQKAGWVSKDLVIMK